ncbi:MAG: hypothetical protein EHM23_03635 [Acidobacteria bacterium]|nr:MAG: hypothetical protein EHM23_03635 [Acidobacteriota bacterium]
MAPNDPYDMHIYASERLWGWCVDRLPFRSARKLLTRSVRAEQKMQRDLGGHLRVVWETRRGSS